MEKDVKRRERNPRNHRVSSDRKKPTNEDAAKEAQDVVVAR